MHMCVHGVAIASSSLQPTQKPKADLGRGADVILSRVGWGALAEMPAGRKRPLAFGAWEVLDREWHQE